MAPKLAVPCSVISCHAGREGAGFLCWGAEGPQGAVVALVGPHRTGQGRVTVFSCRNSHGEKGTGEGLGFSTDLLQAGFTPGSGKDLAIFGVCFASQSGT